MNPDLYKSAQDGNLYELKKSLDDVLVGNNGRLPEQLTTSKSNLLHVLSQFGDFEECVNGILHVLNFEDQQLMLTKQNSVGETALHIASRNGRDKIVQALIQCAQALDREDIESGFKIAEKMMWATDHNGDTAVHNAVKMKHEEIVQLLVKFDPNFKYPANKMEETPLYLAVERGSQYHHIVDIILDNCSSPGYEGPDGRTALHAAVRDGCDECMEKLLKKNLNLAKEANKFGWIPLHLAAYRNDILLMEMLLEYCPDCWDVVNSKSQNILHLTAARNNILPFNFILEQPWAINLINQGDADGNTPLHLLIANYNPFWSVIMIRLMKYHQVDPNAVNKEGFTPLDLLEMQGMDSVNKEGFTLFDIVERQGTDLGGKSKLQEQLMKMGAINRGQDARNKEQDITHVGIQIDKNGNDIKVDKKRENQKKALEELRKLGETQLIMATLIATVTFAAGFTLPGGYDGNEGPNQGMAVLIKKAAFKIFVVSDAVSVASSILSVFLLFAAACSSVDNSSSQDEEKWKNLKELYVPAMIFLVIAKIGMVIAFVTGLYTTLDEGSLGLAISVCSLGGVVLLYIFYKICRVVGLQVLVEYVWDELLGEWRENGCSVWKLAAKAFVGCLKKIKAQV